MNTNTTFKYNPEETINRILMDKNTKYIVVEGEDDIPKFESTLRIMTSSEVDFESVSLGGKGQIKDLLTKNSNKNFIAIADKDFNEHEMPKDERLVILSGYSVENFFFCDDILTALLSSICKDSEAKIKAWFSINEWREHLHTKLQTLLKSLYYYQNHVKTDRKSWTKADILVNNCWKVSDDKVSSLLNSLYDNSIPVVEINQLKVFENINKDELIKYFPGKLLMQSIYRYLKEKIINNCGVAKKFTQPIGSHTDLSIYCTNLLVRHTEFRKDLNPCLGFLGANVAQLT